MMSAMETPAKTFAADVERDIQSLTARGQLKADHYLAQKRLRVRRETALHLAWQEFTEYHGREAALEVLAEAEAGHCPLAQEWFSGLSKQVEEMGL